MKNKQGIVMLILTLVLLNIIVFGLEVSAEKDKKTILIINSHTEDYAWTSDVLRGVSKTINSSNIDVDTYMENFDYRYYGESNIEEEIYKSIKNNYSDKIIDIVITTDFEATKFAVKYRDELFKGTPITFSGVDKETSAQIIGNTKNIAGIVERPNSEETLKTALNITPNAKKIYVIHDNTSRGKINFKDIKDTAREIDKNLKVETLSNIGEIKSDIDLANIPKDSIIIGSIYLEDEKGIPVSMSEVARRLSKSIDIPIFYLQRSTMGHGVLGGSMLIPEEHGVNTGKVALRILRGESASSIGLVEENDSRNIYDYNVMKRFGISEDLLPKDSQILNKEYNPFEEYRKTVIAVITLMILLLLFVIYLSINIKRRKQAEREMILVNNNLVEIKEELEIIAYYDDITGLPNKAKFIKDMYGKIKNNCGYILYIDIDKFKDINDIFGHSFGDLVLLKVAERLKSLDIGNNIYRIGGDEYIIDLEDKDKEYAVEVSRNIKNIFSDQFNIKDQEIKISTSIGIASYPRDSSVVEDLFKKAEISMYKAKELGRNCYKIYEDKMEKEIENRILLEQNLRKALDKDEFILKYQPQINPVNGEVVGFESLIRWKSPDYGLVSPAKFIPVAEEIGEIRDIGKWVLREACEFAMSIEKKYDKEIEISVNVSPVQLKQDDFIDIIKSVIKETGVKPRNIGIEVTETALMECFDENFKKLEILKDMGFIIYLDDFGTGYSSLNYLLKLPIATIKIDKTFIDEMMIDEKGRKITEKIIKLAHKLELTVVAEGVELENQLSFLKTLNCDVIQGYIFGKPLSEEDANKYIKENINRKQI